MIGIDEDDLESCLVSIFETNKDVKFNTIQYSKQKKKLYIYANTEIDIAPWINHNVQNYSKVDSVELISDLTRLLKSKGKYEHDYRISLLELIKIYFKINCDFKTLKFNLIDELQLILRTKISQDLNISIDNFNYDKQEITFEMYEYDDDEYDVEFITFKKENDEYYITKSDTLYDSEWLSAAYKFLPDFFDIYSYYRIFRDFSKDRIPVVGTKLVASIDKEFISIYQRDDFILNSRFEIINFLNKSPYNFDTTCNSAKVLSVIEDNEAKLFANAYIYRSAIPKFILNYEPYEKLNTKSNKFSLKKIFRNLFK